MKQLLAIVLVMGPAIAATSYAQSLSCCTASTAAPPGVTPVLYNLPNGQGSTFTQARTTAGVVDATITLNVRYEDCTPVVNLSDIALFASDHASGMHPFRSDLHHDGFVNLSDIPRLAEGVGAVCH